MAFRGPTFSLTFPLVTPSMLAPSIMNSLQFPGHTILFYASTCGRMLFSAPLSKKNESQLNLQESP